MTTTPPAAAARAHWPATSSIRASRSSACTRPAQRCFSTCASTSQATNRVPMDLPAAPISGLRWIGSCGRNISAFSTSATITAPAKATPTQACHSPGATCASWSLGGTACSCATENQTAATNRNMPTQPRGSGKSRYSPVKNSARPMPASTSHRTNPDRGERVIGVNSNGLNVRFTLHLVPVMSTIFYIGLRLPPSSPSTGPCPFPMTP